MLLTLDISVSGTGWAFGGPLGPTRFGTFDCRRATDVPDVPGPRYERYLAWLDDHLSVIQPRALFFESPMPPKAFDSAVTARQLFTLVGLTEMVAARRPTLIVREEHVSSVRLFFTGSGRSKKDDVLRECYSRGWKPKNDNESDASALWAYAAATDDVRQIFTRAA